MSCQGECYCEQCCECEEETEAYLREQWIPDFELKFKREPTSEEVEKQKAIEEEEGQCRYCNGMSGESNDGNGDVRHCNFCENGCDCYYCVEEKVWQDGERDPRRASNSYAYFPDMGGELQYNNGTFRPRSGNGYK